MGGDRAKELETELRSWPDSKADERRAAWYLAIYLDCLPKLRDSVRAGNGLVDLELIRDGQLDAVAEVMTTIDDVFMGNLAHLKRKVIAAVNSEYDGSGAWGLDFERGVRLPSRRELTRVAPTWAAQLSTSDANMRTSPVALAEGVRALSLAQGKPRGVYFLGANAEVPESFDVPYLNRLSEYLATNENIRKHLEKLVQDGNSLVATRRHLYLLLAGTGKNGGLLASSPSYFTWGEFSAPEGLTDLWLDPSGTLLFHWTAEAGWVCHPDTVERKD